MPIVIESWIPEKFEMAEIIKTITKIRSVLKLSFSDRFKGRK
jgi:hypothetical protein